HVRANAPRSSPRWISSRATERHVMGSSAGVWSTSDLRRQLHVVPQARGATSGGPSNMRMHLTVRPVTRLAGVAPPPISPQGGAQGARPSRPAGDARRYGVHETA